MGALVESPLSRALLYRSAPMIRMISYDVTTAFLTVSPGSGEQSISSVPAPHLVSCVSADLLDALLLPRGPPRTLPRTAVYGIEKV